MQSFSLKLKGLFFFSEYNKRMLNAGFIHRGEVTELEQHRVSYKTCLVWELLNSTERGRSCVLEHLLGGGDQFRAQKEPPEDPQL